MGKRNGVPTIKSKLVDMPVSANDLENPGIIIDCVSLTRAKSARSAVYQYASESGKSFTCWLDGPYGDAWILMVKRVS